MGKVSLSLSAVRQILRHRKSKPMSKEEEDHLVQKIHDSCVQFDKKSSERITEMDIITILGLVRVNCQHDKVYAICSHLPRNKNGKIKIQEFIDLSILSEEAFNALDKNHDGFITKGELKLANKDAAMSDVMQVIEDYDYDKDGKLNMAEYNQYRSDSSEKSIKSIKSIDHENDNDNDLSESDEVVMVNLK